MPKSYWEKRQEQKYLAGEKKINDYYKGLEKSFEQAKKEIQSIINDFYMRYAKENKVSYADAQKLLSRAEIEDLQSFIDKVNKHMREYNLELNNMSIKARITRYQALEQQIDATLQQLYAIEYQHKGEELLKDVYSDSYYRTWYNIDVYKGFHQEFAQVNPGTIEELIKYPFNGANFSTRLWKQKDYMLQQLNESITTMLIRGQNPKMLSDDFAKKFNTKEYDAYRLLHTEGSFIMEQASQKAYEEDGLKKYQWLATLDSKTCEECQPLDGKIFDVGKGITGETLTPKHCFCRCTTVPYYDDMDVDKRIAKDPDGKVYSVDANMTYEDWHKEYIEINPGAMLTEKKIKNYNTDKKQYVKYKEVLGKGIPESFDKFQKLKYNKSEEWEHVKNKFEPIFIQKDFGEIPSFHKNTSDLLTRKWYKWHDENIPNLIDKTKSIEEQARKAHSLRNKYRTQARELMKDQEERKRLDASHPNKTFDELISDKMGRKGMTKEQAIKDILKTAIVTNKNVNKSLGLE